ncbi:MAG: hypothetical protein IT311_10625, partial [Anaerolineales bacterium]|nr:hypothetical protein [Anaerolineales bacterium]
MISRLLNFIRNEDDQDPSFILLARNILFFVMGANILILPIASGVLDESSKNPAAFTALLITLLLQFISLLYLLRGNVYPTKVIVPLSLIVAINSIAFTSNGLKSSGMLGLPIILIASAVLLGPRAIAFIATIIIFSTIAISYFDLQRLIRYIPTGIDDAIIVPILLIACSALMQLLLNRMNENLRKARENEKNYLAENRALTELQTSLEKRVTERTLDLEAATQQSERRARQFEAIAQVSAIVSNIQDSETLISKITQVISEQFGYYHVGIFLLDDNREFA